ncbi:MAG: flagellar FlbD family protein [Clostridia bacterium]|jgi:flagellar protein FlbD|nr:flagellar FlbD family protein [Clostridia bacterium]MDD3970843.1 flagellar FlbD family protein [Clostridia bacterium]NLF37192.1 flagellar FlbD family protein [Clostridiaceae bacterium]HXK71502.1 flagellar FlbD family protein [Clostridia bacterium]
MILLTQLNDKAIVLNCDLIIHIEESPHTVIKMVNADKYIVKESALQVVEKVTMYKAEIQIRAKVG